MPGATIGKYRILAHIATGGMGTVYQARDEELGRIVALKVLTPELSNNPILVDRFKREARAAARLQHKNIVTLYEYGTADGLYYLAMEYIDGVDLGEYIRRRGHLEPEESRRLLIQAAKALEHAYSQGITHRDIKPSNFLLANDEGRCRVKLTDLGLSRIDSETDFKVTRAGTTVGTVDYMAPEQARNSNEADIRSDIYSLGCTLYQMLAGQPPFDEGGLAERVLKHQAADPPDIRQYNPNVSVGLWTVLWRMLAKHPDDRFQTPAELIQALRSLSDPALTPPPTTPLPTAPPAVETVQTNAPTPVPDIPPAPIAPPPASAPARQAQPKKRRKTTVADLNTVADDAAELLGVTPEQRHAAAGQFAHATEVLRTNGDPAYAEQLLLSCVKLDPANLMYRKMLREVGRDMAPGRKSSWFGSLTNLPARGRLKKAMHAGDYRKALECGEELLCRAPGDITAQLDMAAAAEALGLRALAIWLLEEARGPEGKSVTVLRALARMYERDQNLNKAIAVWEQVRELVPDDIEAGDKIRELSVNETLARSNFRI